MTKIGVINGTTVSVKEVFSLLFKTGAIRDYLYALGGSSSKKEKS